jgi:hypothetical protein
VVEDHDRAVVDGQAPKSPLERLAVRYATRVVGDARLEPQALHAGGETASSAKLVSRRAHEDPVQPPVEGGDVAELRELTPAPDESLLDRILRQIGVAQDQPGHGVQAVDLESRELPESLPVTLPRPFDEVLPHASTTVRVPVVRSAATRYDRPQAAKRSIPDGRLLTAADICRRTLAAVSSVTSVTGVSVEVGLFLAGYPEPIAKIAHRLRALVRQATPDAIERIRSGWALIGYDLPIGRRKRFFAFIAPERKHVHLGFEYGVWMADPEGILEGAHLKLKKVRFVTFEPGDLLPDDKLVTLTREAARVATWSRAERLAALLDASERAERP